MIPVKETFSKGGFDYQLIDRKEDVCIYAQSDEGKLIAFLIGLYKDVPNMLNDFWQSSSDACPLEATEQDEQLNKWAKYVYGKCRP